LRFMRNSSHPPARTPPHLHRARSLHTQPCLDRFSWPHPAVSLALFAPPALASFFPYTHPVLPLLLDLLFLRLPADKRIISPAFLPLQPHPPSLRISARSTREAKETLARSIARSESVLARLEVACKPPGPLSSLLVCHSPQLLPADSR